MLHIIQERLRRGVCDEVMEVAWSLMWNITGSLLIDGYGICGPVQTS